MNLSELIFPRVCMICGRELRGRELCSNCADELNKRLLLRVRRVYLDGTEYSARFLYGYGADIVKRYVFALKRRANSMSFDFAAAQLAEYADEIFGGEPYTVSYIPRKRVNVRKYGYDQSKNIAIRLSKRSALAEYKPLLKRRGFSKEQKYLSASERKLNVSGVFKAVRKNARKNILLIDDVITTGSSFCSCIRALKEVYGESVNIAGLFIAST